MQFACAQSGSQLSKSTRKTADIESCTGQTWQNKWGCLKIWYCKSLDLSALSHIFISSYTIPIKIAIWGAPPFQTHPNCQDTQSCGYRYQRSRVDCCEVLSRPTVSQQCCKPSIEIREQLFTHIYTKDSNAGSGQILQVNCRKLIRYV